MPLVAQQSLPMIAIQDNPDIRNPDNPLSTSQLKIDRPARAYAPQPHKAHAAAVGNSHLYLISSNDPTVGNSPTNGFKYCTNASVILFPSEI